MLFSRILYQIPTCIQRMFRGVVWRKDTCKKCVYLTFDDGPGDYTEQLLDCLEANNARATFFMLGQNVQEYPDIPKRMLENGIRSDENKLAFRWFSFLAVCRYRRL